MIAAALLLAYAAIMGTAGARRLHQASWPQRSPRLGIVAWQALTLSVVLAAMLAGAVLAVPTPPVSTGLATLLDACLLAIRDHYSTPGGAAVASLGALTVIVVVGRLGYVLAVEVVTTSWRRAGQRRRLLMVARHDPPTGALVVPHPRSAVYCLPGRGGLIVCTTAAFAALDVRQLGAALAHERAHLRWRHDLVLTGAAMLRAAFPFVPAFSLAQTELLRLVEMQADDIACAGGDRQVLATALVRLAEGAAPVATIGAGGNTALARVHRLAGPADPLGLPCSALAAGAALMVVMLPLLIAAGPAVVAAIVDYCPLGFPPES